ncbi:hypothetical protein NECAME_00525 [Necator americanus]|uniref:Uncharacterized protein n=1 Tax=Necator americanus TaxID=51031 RepID=W2T5V3_NECAM|nr:hypothetical protein NECAME_00525 [Necator americanus]ETN76999.1 hypothetical protein NECAME_00525 [Necator americanus]
MLVGEDRRSAWFNHFEVIKNDGLAIRHQQKVGHGRREFPKCKHRVTSKPNEIPMEITMDINCTANYGWDSNFDLLHVHVALPEQCNLFIISDANPLFGWWNQKTMSIKYPVIVGMLMTAAESQFTVVPKYDLIPALICIYLWVVTCMVSINIEVISTPWSTAMYNWKDSDAVLYNGIFQTASCLVSVSINFAIGYTRVGHIEKRKQIIFGLIMFLLFHILNYPWTFYSGPLDYIPMGMLKISYNQFRMKCLQTKTPLKLVVAYTLMIGAQILYVSHSLFTLFALLFSSEYHFHLLVRLREPCTRKYSDLESRWAVIRFKGMMQGLHSFGGSIAQLITPILTTFLFQHSGYKYVMVVQICTLSIALLLVVVFYKRLVPLKMKPAQGKSAKYKHGVFYTM